MMTTNGGGLLSNTTEKIDGLLKHINTIAMDDYENVNIVDKIRKNYKGKHEFKFYPDDPKVNPHRRRGRNEKLLVVIRPIDIETKGVHATINNHCGAGAPLNDSANGKRCAKPFREMSVRWDGQVSLCCNDWRGVYDCGSVQSKDIEEIWNGPEFGAARNKLYHGLRDFGPCQGCDALSYRPGLLPDQKGKEELPLPTKEDLKVIKRLERNPPMTQPVLRTWELQK